MDNKNRILIIGVDKDIHQLIINILFLLSIINYQTNILFLCHRDYQSSVNQEP
jgi:hypothetical protein